MNWHNVLLRPRNLYEELLRRKLISGGGLPVYEATSTTGAFYTDMVAPLKKLLVRFMPKQSGSGEPSPSNVRPIEKWTNVVVRHNGKNLYNKTLISGNVLLDNLVVGKTYTASADMKNPNTNTYFYIQRSPKDSETKTTVGYVIAGTTIKPVTFTVSEGYDYWAFSNNTYTNVKDIQIEEGSEATEYEPYIEAGHIIGRNLFDKTAYTPSSITYNSESGEMTKNGIRVDLTPGTYTLRGNSETVYGYIYSYLQSADGSYKSRHILSTTSSTGWRTATVTFSDGDYLVIVAATSGVLPIDDMDLQIEVGSEATEYEPYQGVGYEVSWGKNLLNVEALFTDTRNYVVNEDKSITILQSNGNAWTSDVVPSISLKAGTYTFSRTNPIGATTIRSSADNYASDIARLSAGDDKKTFTLAEDAIVKLKVNTGSSATYPNTTFIQLEEGDTATAYQPYVGTVYGGTIDFVSGVLTVDRAFMTFDGTQTVGRANWRPLSNSVGWLYSISATAGILHEELKSDNLSNLIADRMETVVYGGSSGVYGADKTCISIVGGTSWGIAMRVSDTSLNTESAINAWLADNPVSICYKLETPTTIQLTPQQIRTLMGNNVVTAEGADVIEVVYLTHLVSLGNPMSEPEAQPEQTEQEEQTDSEEQQTESI